jgi:hypothetical protein
MKTVAQPKRLTLRSCAPSLREIAALGAAAFEQARAGGA